MGENTVEIAGVAYDEENLFEAAQDVAEQSDGRGISVVGDVCIIDDGHDDSDVKIRKDGRIDSARVDVDYAIDKAESALEDSFESYVKNAVADYGGETEIGEEVKGRMSNHFGHGYDILLWKHYSLTSDLTRELIDDDGIEFGYVRPVDNGILVGLNDSRE